MEVYSWWNETDERAAFDELVNIHQRTHENVEVVNLVKSRSGDARGELAQRMLAEAPPSSFQANLGSDVLKWAMVDTQDYEDAGGPQNIDGGREAPKNLLTGLSRFFADTGLADHLPEDLLSHLRAGAGTVPYAVPINIHRENLLYFNTERRDRFEAETGKNLLDIDVLCKGDREVLDHLSIAVGLDDKWPLVLLVIENLVPAIAEWNRKDAENRGLEHLPPTGAEVYRNVLEGRMQRNDENQVVVREALECAKRLSIRFLRASNMTWAEAVRRVKSDATFTVMGNWANALIAEDLKPGPDGQPARVVAAPFPGTESLYVYTSDSFPLPLGIDHSAETTDFLRTVADADAQVEFSKLKGSIPARTDAHFVSPPGWSSLEEFTGASERLLANSGHFPPYYPEGDLQTKLVEMTADDPGAGTVDAALNVLLDAEPLLANWQARLEAGVEP